MSDQEPEKGDDSLHSKIEEFNAFLEELESEWVEEEPEKPAKVIEETPVKKAKADVKPKAAPKTEKKSIPKPRPIDPSTQEIHVDLETGEVTFDDLDLLDELDDEDTQGSLDELIDAEVSKNIEIDDVKSQVAEMKASVTPFEFDDEEAVKEEDETEEEFIFGDVVKEQLPETFAYNYLFARFPINFLIILIPQTIGLLASIFINTSFETESSPFELKESNQFDLIDNYLLAVKISLVILLAFFLCYRWSVMQNDGSYGYWLTQGVNRRRFFIGTYYRFLLVIYFGIFLGIMSLFYLNSLYVDGLTFLKLNLLIISHIVVIIGLGIFIGVFTKNPESAALIFIMLLGANYAFNTDGGTLWNKILQSDLQYKAAEGDVWLSLFMSMAFGAILAISSLRVHLNLDMEL